MNEHGRGRGLLPTPIRSMDRMVSSVRNEIKKLEKVGIP
jgi:hypothetical protein